VDGRQAVFGRGPHLDDIVAVLGGAEAKVIPAFMRRE